MQYKLSLRYFSRKIKQKRSMFVFIPTGSIYLFTDRNDNQQHEKIIKNKGKEKSTKKIPLQVHE